MHVSRTLLVSIAAAGLLAACSGSTSATSATQGGYGGGSAMPAVTSSPMQAAGVASTVTVTEKEYSLVPSPTSVPAGPVTFTITNSGTVPHDVVVNGPGVDNQASAMVDPGSTGTLTVTLSKGEYTIFCNVPGHRDRGMVASLTVS